MGGKSGAVFRLAVILFVMCVILLILVPVGSAEFYILAFSGAADLAAALLAARQLRSGSRQ